MPHPCCHPERSVAESKDLRFYTLSQGWETTTFSCTISKSALCQGTTSVVPHGCKMFVGFSP